MHNVIHAFLERYDGDHHYKIGNTYPREGFTPSEGRVSELVDGSNRVGIVFLEKADEPQSEPRGRRGKKAEEE